MREHTLEEFVALEPVDFGIEDEVGARVRLQRRYTGIVQSVLIHDT